MNRWRNQLEKRRREKRWNITEKTKDVFGTASAGQEQPDSPESEGSKQKSKLSALPQNYGRPEGCCI